MPDDPEATALSFQLHKELASRIVYFAGAGGNANNWALSAHGKTAVDPSRLSEALVLPGLHRPIIHEVLDERGNVLRSNIATSCIGFAAPALAAQDLRDAKPKLKDERALPRLLHEGTIAFNAVRRAPSFSAELRVVNSFAYVEDLTSLEFIKSRTYAKQGRTQVNVDDTRWQPVVTRQTYRKIESAQQLAATMIRLKLGHHALESEDLAGRGVLLKLQSDEPIHYHADGETDDSCVLEPGQTMRMRLSQIAVPTLIVV